MKKDEYRIGQCWGCGRYTALKNNYCENCQEYYEKQKERKGIYDKELPEDLKNFLGL